LVGGQVEVDQLPGLHTHLIKSTELCEHFKIILPGMPRIWDCLQVQWDVDVRPVFKQEVDIWNIYCKAMWRAEWHRP
jgi:hypothetical protein